MIPSRLKSKLSLKKKDGNVIENILGLVSQDWITIEELDLIIDEGDVFFRTLPNQKVEEFEVISLTFSEMPKPGMYRIKYRKKLLSKIEQKEPVTIIHANNSRIYSHSVDNSINIDVGNNLETFSKIEDIIRNNIGDEIEKDSILKSVEDLKNSTNSSTYISKYKAFIDLTQKHISLIAPFVPFLTNYL